MLKLSDAFISKPEEATLELTAHMININYGHNQELMEKCDILKGYSIFVHKVKLYSATIDLKDAIDRGISECITENVLKEFFEKRRNEVMECILSEYDEKEVMEMLQDESFEEGKIEGKIEGKAEIISLVRKKHEKGLSVEEIADLLEQDKYGVNQIVTLIEANQVFTDLQIAQVVLSET